MSLRWNLAAGLAQSVWTALIGLAVVPFYLTYLGLEPYGLIGFFMSMQALFALLDMGLTPTMNREVARCRALGDNRDARNLLHSLGIAFWVVVVAIGATTAFLAPLISSHWLGETSLPPGVVSRSVALMGIVIALRFPVGLYTGALMGGERLVLVSGIGIFMVTLANVGAIVVLALVSPTIEAFFVWQAVVGLVWVATVQIAAWRVLSGNEPARFDRTGLKRVWRFSAGIGGTALFGTIFIHSDKILLAKIVSLEELGQYTLAGLVARCLYLFLSPTFNAIYPRLTALYTNGDIAGMVSLYRDGTRLLMAIVFPVAAYVAVFSVELVTLWTGNAQLGESLFWVLCYLLLGTALNGAMHFPYALQLAAGKAHIPLIINSTLIFTYIPLLLLLSTDYGITGAAAAWAILNGFYVFYGTWLTHREILKGVGSSWLIRDVGLPFIVSAVLVLMGGTLMHSAIGSPYTALAIGALLPLLAFGALVATSHSFQALGEALLPRWIMKSKTESKGNASS
ncbi:oligosaccharide flippase family protein [Sphingomonas lutea]|uniref:Oligosaccharide flippase family protein n=1 Tax=Sphingomonas lutea TaxID=1045317 RepID=A0A7G9SEW1_9SPHN|nr:oligosaccharide flippase family protein [Sphingomonas lutea]QNN66386.1 oligosaccharide flippase family protein [Sphingomonas lutea]